VYGIKRYNFDMTGIAAFDNAVPYITTQAFKKCGPDWRIWETQIRGAELTYIIKGGARYTVNDVEYELESGDLLYLTEGDIVEAVTHPQHPMWCFTVAFTVRYLTKKASAAAIRDLFATVSHVRLHQDVVNMFRELTVSWTEQQHGYVIKTQALFMLILCRLSEIIHDSKSSGGDYRISRVTRYIAKHYAEKLTVKELAQQINLSEVYLGHLFKTETGMTVHQYMTKVRVRNAETLLQDGRYKIHEVAELCGFSDIFHFYKSFKALRGFPPSKCVPRKNTLDPEEKP